MPSCVVLSLLTVQHLQWPVLPPRGKRRGKMATRRVVKVATTHLVATSSIEQTGVKLHIAEGQVFVADLCFFMTAI